MAVLRTWYKNEPKFLPDLKTNFDVDFVIHYRVPDAENSEAEAAFVELIGRLSDVGFVTEVRSGDKSSILVFAKVASNQFLAAQVYRSRLHDWLFGVRMSAPGQDLTKCFEEEPISEAERLRLAYLLMTKSRDEGGAGITPRTGRWTYVASVFPLHDHAFNRTWIQDWSAKYFLDQGDLDKIRDRFGEQVAFYFAFLQSYSVFLLFPAAFGFGAWLLLGQFSWFYAMVNCLWAVVFFEHWKSKEFDLAVQWGVKGVSKIQQPRTQFQFEREAKDPATGEIVKMYSPFKRLARQLLQVPFAMACVVVLGGLIATCFAIEIFITEVYTGAFKEYLTFTPTVLLTIFIPTLSTLLTKLAEKLTSIENYETQDAHTAAFVQKIFVLNFITSYMPILLTAFVYVPFGKVLVPYLDVSQLTAARLGSEDRPLPTKEWEINPDRLTKQVIYFTVTAQMINFLTEVVVPCLKRKVCRAVKDAHTDPFKDANDVQHSLSPQEAAFLKRVRNEADLEAYDVTVDYREMIVQFGYLSLFSVVWPLTGCSFLVNNWVEARSDAMKIAIGSRRPIPWRADSIGPWLNSLGFLAWLGSVTSAALVYLFSAQKDGPDGSPHRITGWALLLSIIFAEHVYLVVQILVRNVIKLVDRPGLHKERAERFAMRRRVLEQTFGMVMTDDAVASAMSGGQKITRKALEEARRASVVGKTSAEEMFWLSQRGAEETIQVGRDLIKQIADSSSKT